MNKHKRFLITGALGFIGSSLIRELNNQGHYDIYICDYAWTKKWQNLVGLCFNRPILSPREAKSHVIYCDTIFHLGGNSSTQAENSPETWTQNYEYTIELLQEAQKHKRKFIFASSASTYGAEEVEFAERIYDLKPQSFYAYSKLCVDQYIHENRLENVYSFRFFNVFGGAKERFKGNMSSVIYRWLTQDINTENPIKLFESLRPEYKHGHQARDFVSIWDVCNVLIYTANLDNDRRGIYNLGSGKARTWLDIATYILQVRGLDQNLIQFTPLPDAIKNQYQYFTQSNNYRLVKELGYSAPFLTLEEGIKRTWDEISAK